MKTLLLLLMLALPLTTFAEGSGSSAAGGSSSGSGSGSSSNSSSSGSGSGSGGGGGNSFSIGAANFSPGSVTQATPPKNSDRQTQSKAAAAAARAGAGLQRVMCFKMMNDARKEQNSTDKAIMQMMAQQACQQASQTEQNADKNDKAAQALSADDVPKQGQLVAGKFELKPSATDEPLTPPVGDSGSGGDQSSYDESATLVSPIDPSNYTLKTPAREATAVPTTVAKLPEDPTSPLAPMKPSSVGYDENASKGGPGIGGLGNGFGSGGLGSPLAAAVGGSPYNGAKTVAEDGKNRGGEEGTGKERSPASLGAVEANVGPGGGGPSGGGDSEKSGESSPLDAMLAQMMGGGAPTDGAAIPGQDVLVLPEKDSQGGTKLPNIFEFANWRYQKAAFEEGRVRTRVPTAPTLTDSASKVARASKR